MTLSVVEIFDSLQGEGFWTGVPMTFVRLAGCNARELGLECVRWCDTPEAWEENVGEPLAVGDILDRVNLPRLCLTGGEPLLQLDDLIVLARAAGRRGLRVHVESNGTIGPGATLCCDPGPSWVTLSPKPPEYLIDEGWQGLVDELKLVADENLDAAAAERLAAAHPEALVCIQPCWEEAAGFTTVPEGNARPGAGADLERAVAGGPWERPGGAGFERAVALVMAHPDWRLSLQTHKYLGIR